MSNPIFKDKFLNELSEIGLDNEVLDRSTFKPNSKGILEIDWAGFMTFQEVRKRASRPMQIFLNILDHIYK